VEPILEEKTGYPTGKSLGGGENEFDETAGKKKRSDLPRER